MNLGFSLETTRIPPTEALAGAEITSLCFAWIGRDKWDHKVCFQASADAWFAADNLRKMADRIEELDRKP